MANTTIHMDNNNKHSKLLSSLFCSTSIIVLSILCLLNNLTLDLYTTITLLKIVIPASLCFWLIGYSMGRILDTDSKGSAKQEFKLSDNQEAYAIPSMFTAEGTDTNNSQIEEI